LVIQNIFTKPKGLWRGSGLIFPIMARLSPAL
jgi:hypothetical protein